MLGVMVATYEDMWLAIAALMPTRSPEIAPSSFAGVGAGDGAMAQEHGGPVQE